MTEHGAQPELPQWNALCLLAVCQTAENIHLYNCSVSDSAFNTSFVFKKMGSGQDKCLSEELVLLKSLQQNQENPTLIQIL